MYLNHQLFENFPFIDVKYLCMSSQRKASVSTSPLWCEDLPVWFVSTWGCTKPAILWLWSVGSPLSCSSGKWRNNSTSSDWMNGHWAELPPCHPEQHMQAECHQSRALQGCCSKATCFSVIAADGTCISPHCACPLLVPSTCLSKVVRGWWYSYPSNITCAK